MNWQLPVNFYFLLSVLSLCLAQQQPADSSANTKTRQVLTFLADLAQQGKLLSGQFAGYSPDTFSTSIIDQITQQIGKTPGILGCDWACGWNYKTPPEDLINYSCNSALKTHWNLGGLVTVNMHLPNPVSSNGGGYKDRGNLNFADLINTTTQTGQRWHLFLDRVADGLNDLQQAGVTVLFRPFHEMNGEWFYWGNQDAQTFRNVWINMFNYLTNTKNLHNVLWVYSPDHSRGNRLAYYPGSAYVDVVALDVYTDDPNSMNGYDEMITLNKVFALGEVGPSTVNNQFEYTRWLTAIETKFPNITYFLAWNDGWAPISNKHACAFYNHHRVLNREDMTLNNTLLTTTTTSTAVPSTVSFTTASSTEGSAVSSSSGTTSSSSSATVIYNFSNGIGQWQGWNLNGGPWQSNEFTFSSTDSLKADVQLYSGGKSSMYTNQASTFIFSGYQRLVVRARVASWGFSSSGTMSAKLYIKTGSSWTWYDSGLTPLNSNSATQIILNLSTIPAADLTYIREVGVEFTSSDNGSQTAVYIAYITAEN
ncbi:unnamed protein product [Adineta ricciae]|uniref:GH26 domain-containing protein n=1 Tax=Adineta ricciae TaxID=249248 RepID=A0A814XTE0_ADIRI|nr:unnamed protein product [Adineta ricciae]